MTTSTPISRITPENPPKNGSVAFFRPPPLGATVAIDVSKDLAAVRRRRAMLSQRLSAVWLRGHVRDGLAA